MNQSKAFTDKAGPQCILCVDDEVSARQAVSMFLDDLGYLVLEADNGDAGLQLLNQQCPDLILLDLRMPGLNGLDFLKQVRKTDSDIPIIVISGTGEITDVVEALRLGATDFLLKPIIDLLVLQHSVEKALEQSHLRRENQIYREHLEEIISQRTIILERTYQQLLQSEEKYRSIYENLQDIYFETTLDGILLEISPALEKNTLHKRATLLGTSIQELYVNPEQRSQMIQALLAKGRIEDQETMLFDADGHHIYFSVNARLHFDSSGAATHISGVMRNISERKISEEALRVTNQTLEALFNAAPLAIMAVDTELRITLWNSAAEKIFGWQRDEIIGQVYPLSAEKKATNAKLERALAGEHLQGLELTRLRKDGQPIAVSTSTASLHDSNGAVSGLIVIIEDVSEKQLLRSEADRYSRLASLGELAAGVAHEINNPNGLIMLNLPTVRDFVIDAIRLQQDLAMSQPGLKLGGIKPERAAEAFPQLMDEIDESARRIKQIVDDLKSFAGQGNYKQDVFFDLNRSVETAIRLTANHLKVATDHVDIQLAEDLPALNGSGQRIEQVIINLLVNACEALTDKSQQISITTGQDAETKEVFLCISDEGCGISAQQLPHITDPFFTTRRETGGTGLGLSVSARIIKEHNGRINFKSTPGQGTSACIYFAPQKAEK